MLRTLASGLEGSCTAQAGKIGKPALPEFLMNPR
jgi:hypothetical protein